MVDYLRKQFQGIDIAKLVSAVLIMIMHTGLLASVNSDINYYVLNTICRIAVPFFFICNGFFIFRNININNIQFGDIKKPLIKLIKLYLIWTVIYFPYYLFVSIRGGSFDALSFIKTFLLELVWYGTYPVFWYVLASIYGLIIISLLLKIKVKPLFIFIISLPLYAFGLFITVYGGFVTNESVRSFMGVSNNIFGGTMNVWFNGLTFMSLGLCIWYYKPQVKKAVAICLLLLFISLFFLEHIFLCTQGYGNALTTSISLFFLIPALFYLLLSINPDINTSEVRKISILLYFVHTAFNLVVYQFIKILGLLDTTWWSPARFILVFSLSFGFSYLIVLLGKKVKWINQLF